MKMEIRAALRPYVPVAEMLAATFGPDCEVVLHDLTVPERSVVHVANPTVTERRLGDSFDQLVRQVILSDELRGDYAANYYFIAKNGKRIRSSSLLIRGEDGRLEGALCINLDTTRVQAQLDFLQGLLPQPAGQVPQRETAEPEHISVMIENLMDSIAGGADAASLTREQRIEKVRFMEEKGLFLMKGSVERAAEKLGVNKVTIYSYLDEVRGKHT